MRPQKPKQTNFTKRHCAKNGHIEFSQLGRYIAPTEKKFFFQLGKIISAIGQLYREKDIF